MKNGEVKKILKEYEAIKPLYKDFSLAVKFILETILKDNQFKYQVVSCREKSIASLERKLREDPKVKKLKLNSVQEIDDLAGCRIIFYTDDDVQRFINHIYKEFKVVKHNLKYSEDDYNALHLVVEFKKDRLKLSEYGKFKILRCEVQLTTLLYHAWSEMAHGVVYKPKRDLLEFHKRAFDSLKKQFSEVMKKHLKEAQYTFNFIAKEIEKIKQGKQVFNTDFLKSILESKSNNELFENLKILLKYVEEFGDKTPKELKIIDIIRKSLKKSKKLKKEPIKTILGELPGHDYSDLADVCLDILERLKFVYIEEVFDILLSLSIEKNNKIKKKSLDIIARLVKYTYWPREKKIYYFPQLIILDKIEKWSDKDIIKYSEALNTIAKEILSPSFEGTSLKDYKTFVFHQGALPASDTLKKIRKRILMILKKAFKLYLSIREKRRILQSLEMASHIPRQGNYSNELEEIIKDNINELVVFYIEILATADNEIIKTIEEQSYGFSKKFGENIKDLKKLRDLIPQNGEYEIYKVLVGYGYRFSDALDWRNAEEKRKQKIQEYIDQITTENFNEWKKIILSVAKNYDEVEDRGEYQYFNIFFNELGKQKPKIAIRLFSEKSLTPFFVHLIAGIWGSSEKESARRVLKNWVNKGIHLSISASLFDYVKEIDKELIKNIFKKAKQKNDVEALSNMVRSIVGNYEKSKFGKDIFVKCIQELGRHKNYWWINHVWFKESKILEELNKKEWCLILKTLLYIPTVDSYLEGILKIVASKYPAELIKFFKTRVQMRGEKKEEMRYDAIPFQLRKLNKPLSEHSKLVIQEILKWFKSNNPLLYMEGSQLIQSIFPSFHKDLENELIKLIKSKNKNRVRIVLNILRAYEGEKFLHRVCKEFIRRFPKNKRYKQEMFIVLSQMGVVSGKYGFVEGYKNKKKLIQSWKKDKSKVIKNFVKEYEKYLDDRIRYEKKAVEEEIEIRKREFEQSAGLDLETSN
ncbi:MAG: hypothetical protein ACTSQ8_12715 [Candidatus Helarchaeota archaeon]